MLHMKTLAEIPSVVVVIKYKMFRIRTDTWKLQILIKRMDSEIFLYVQYLYKGKWYSTIHFNLWWIINFLSRWNKLQCTNFLHTFKSNNLCPPRWRCGSGLDCGSEDQDSIPDLLSLRVGPLMARRLKTSSDDLVPVCGWLGTLKTPSCPLRWVPGSRS